MYKTFNGWKLAGRVVEAGQRGVFRNEYGDFMFRHNQTRLASPIKIDAHGRAYRKVYI